MSSLRILSRAVRPSNILTRPARATTTPLMITRTSSRKFSFAQRLHEKYYTESHEWIELAADGKTGSIGISKHAADLLGDIVFVEMPEIPEGGLELAEGDTMGAVESVKSASDLYTPVGGKIVEMNAELEAKPSMINKSPEGEGWIAKIELAEGEREKVEKLMDTTAYKTFCDE